MSKNKTKSQRQLQIGEQIKRALAEIFLTDHLFESKKGHITVTQADVSPDAKNAKIFINIFGEVNEKKAVSQLNELSPYLRSKLANKANFKYVPQLQFMLDGVSQNVMKIEDLLNQESNKFS
ncbi:MAG: ribosome-binding factor A [Lentimonas sp.]|jgi:ribosome-binding factor A